MKFINLLLLTVLAFNSTFAIAGYPGETPSYTSVKAGNIQAASNTISSTNTNGDINLTPNGSGNIKVLTKSQADNSTNAASTAYVDVGLATKQGTLTNSAGLAGALSDETGTGVSVFSISPALTGSPTAPTQSAADNSTKIATTAYVDTGLGTKQATGNYVTALTGDVTASGPGSAAATLATVNSNTGSFGSGSLVPVITVNAKGLITAVSTTSVSAGTPSFTSRAVSTTDTATTADITLYLSGASFSETLYTAVSNSDKRITLVHNGTSLSQVYTVVAPGGQTIGGQASIALYTNGETIELQPDGTNWKIIRHYCETDWSSVDTYIKFYTFTVVSANATLASTYTNGAATCTTAKTIAAQTTLVMRCTSAPAASGTLTKTSGTGDAAIVYSAQSGAPYNVSATTTPPTFYGTPDTNEVRWMRRGRYLIMWVKIYTTVAGIIGSGDYIFPLISNVTIDTAISPLYTAGSVQSGIGAVTSYVDNMDLTMAGGLIAQNGSTQMLDVSGTPYTNTSYRVYGYTVGGGVYAANGSTYLAANNTSLAYNFKVMFPISGWLP